MFSINEKPSLYTIMTLVLCMLSVYFVLWSFTGITPLKPNPYNSYALQAQAWLNGHLDLTENYSHLEIAEYNNKYYISFPPFPSVIMLPFVVVFGTRTPDHLITSIFGMIGAIYALKMAYLKNIKEHMAIFFVLFATVASNFLFVGTNGYVWFMAQTFSFSLSLAALYYALTDDCKTHPLLSLLLWSFSVGCRPFQIVYFPLYIYLLFLKYHKIHPKAEFVPFLIEKWQWLIPPILVGLLYMLLNLLRFYNPFEFGHNYLPEFQEAKQFDLSYILYNIKRLFRLPNLQDGKLIFPKFDGVAFWLVSPIYVSYVYFGLQKVSHILLNKNAYIDKNSDSTINIISDEQRPLQKKEAANFIKSFFLVTILVMIHILLLCSHRTMGGWHFGNRYTVDAIPYIFTLLLLFDAHHSKHKMINGILFMLGLCINIVGSIAVYNNWI